MNIHKELQILGFRYSTKWKSSAAADYKIMKRKMKSPKVRYTYQILRKTSIKSLKDISQAITRLNLSTKNETSFTSKMK